MATDKVLFGLPYQDEERAVLLCVIHNLFPWRVSEESIMLFAYPTLRQEFKAVLAQKVVTEDARAKDIITETELVDIALVEGSWTEAEEKEYQGLYSSIRSPRIRDAERQQLMARYVELLGKRWELTDNSAERLGLRAKNRKLLDGCIMRDNGRNGRPELKQGGGLDIYETHFQSFMDWANGLNTRGLAKLPHARQLWAASGSVETMLGGVLSDWTQLQIDFIGWLRFYDSVHQSMDCPPDNVMEDDHLLDEWLEKQRAEAIKQRRDNYHKKKGHTGALVGLDKTQMPHEEGVTHLADHMEANKGLLKGKKDLSLWDNPEAFEKLGLLEVDGARREPEE